MSQVRKEEVAAEFPFCKGVPRNEGVVEVLRREVPHDRGPKTYIDVRVWVGERYLFLPRRALKEIIISLQQAEAAAEIEYQKLFSTRPAPPAQRGESSKSRAHRSGRNWSREDSDHDDY